MNLCWLLVQTDVKESRFSSSMRRHNFLQILHTFFGVCGQSWRPWDWNTNSFHSLIKYWYAVDLHLIKMGGNPINHSIQTTSAFRNGYWLNHFYTINRQPANLLEGIRCLPCKVKLLLIRDHDSHSDSHKRWMDKVLWRTVTVVTRLLWFLKLLLNERLVVSCVQLYGLCNTSKE